MRHVRAARHEGASTSTSAGSGLLTPAGVRRLLAAHGVAPRKALGQNFVVDPNTVRKVVRDANIASGDHVVEIGAGLGSLTLALRQAGAEVVAVEIDAGLVRALRDALGADSGVRIVAADALTVDLAALVEHGPAAMVANLPYNLATAIVLRALRAEAFDRLLVMVQREVGQRWAARVGDPLYGAVSVKIEALASARVVAPVSRNAFYPVPNVDSVTVRLDPVTPPDDLRRLFAAVEAGFGHRRKRLRNAMASAGWRPADVEAALVAVGRDAGARAEELDLSTWRRLAGELPPAERG